MNLFNFKRSDKQEKLNILIAHKLKKLPQSMTILFQNSFIFRKDQYLVISFISDET